MWVAHLHLSPRFCDLAQRDVNFLSLLPGRFQLMHFRKYEGLGNDFVVVGDDIGPKAAQRLCDRRFGIGADGVLVVGHTLPYRMTVYNADGSVPEMCGNGLRCVALYVRDHVGEAAPHFVVETDAGPRSVEVSGDLVTVDMGAARDDGWTSVEVNGIHHVGRRVDVGNPHLVLFADSPWSDEVFHDLGAALQRHDEFPGGVNVSFAERLTPGGVRLQVWERGSGPTLACGTGACATVAAGWWSSRLEGEVQVELPGASST